MVDVNRNLPLNPAGVNQILLGWPELFESFTVLSGREEEVIRGPLARHVAPDDPLLRSSLEAWPGGVHLRAAKGGWMLVLTRRTVPPRRERWWLHALLFALTLLTATVAGSYLSGRAPLMPLTGAGGIPLRPDWPELLPGALYALPLLGILLGHELGHYLVARRRGLDASPPYFIPGPHWINLIGTFGAFIRLRSALVNRAVLLDVGAAGPLVSFLISLPVLAAGLALSTPVPVGGADSVPAPFLILFGEVPIWVGGSLAVHLVAALFAPAGEVVLLHPLAFAGWIGLFVTVLNLFPLAQLDGGHILYALSARAQLLAGAGFLIGLLLLGWLFWPGWWVWAMLILLIGRGRIAHPPVIDPISEIGTARQLVAWACIGIFLVCFVPMPLAL
jgi:membrane-associated protease RseP (regulator of RpoE activity)